MDVTLFNNVKGICNDFDKMVNVVRTFFDVTFTDGIVADVAFCDSHLGNVRVTDHFDCFDDMFQYLKLDEENCIKLWGVYSNDYDEEDFYLYIHKSNHYKSNDAFTMDVRIPLSVEAAFKICTALS